MKLIYSYFHLHQVLESWFLCMYNLLIDQATVGVCMHGQLDMQEGSWRKAKVTIAR